MCVRQGKGDFYSLVTLLVFLRNVKVKLAEYIATAKTLNVSTVHFIDRKARRALNPWPCACLPCPGEPALASPVVLTSEIATPVAPCLRTAGGNFLRAQKVMHCLK